MAFTMPDYPLLKPEQVNPFANLSRNAMEAYTNAIQARYLPMTTQAEAASKMAYANLMGPQFLAKLMGNQDILANIPDPQKRSALQLLLQAGTGQGTGAGIGQSGGQGTVSPLSQPSPAFNNQQNLSPQDRQAIGNLQPGQSYTIPQPGATESQLPLPPETPSKTFAESAGEYAGTKEELKKSGEIRAQDMRDLNDVVFDSDTNLTTLNEINKLLNNPTFQQIRQLPIGGHYELSYYAARGTPEQKQAVGQYRDLTNELVKTFVGGFKGQARNTELGLANLAKPTDSDTIDSAKGKIEGMLYLQTMIKERARITSEYMQRYHMSKGQAQDMADRLVNGDAIRSRVTNLVNPKPSEADIKFMAQKYNLPEDEVVKRLTQKGLM